jgi:putative flippase GtrA
VAIDDGGTAPPLRWAGSPLTKKVQSDMPSLGMQGSRFVVAGLATALLDYGVLYVLAAQAGIGYFVSAAVGFVVGSACNYVISIHWIFIPGRYAQRVEFTFFMVTSVIGLIINQIVMWFFVEIMTINYLFAKAFAITIVATWNFTAKKKLVFVN